MTQRRVRFYRPPSVALIRVLGAAVALRLTVAFYLGDAPNSPPLLYDQVTYHTLATRLLSGHGFSFPTAWYPFTAANTPTAHWSFLYPLYLAAIYAITGVHPLAARLVGAVLGGILLPLGVYRWSLRLFPGRARLARLSAACSAVYLYFVLYAATLMTETYYICALLWSLDRALALSERPTARDGALLGLSLGIATLLRQSILPWVIVLFLSLLWVGRFRTLLSRTVRSLLLALLVLGLCILPFTLRNYLVYGQFLLLNSNAGYATYSAQHPMHGTTFSEFAAAPVPPEVLGHPEPQMDRELMRLGIGFVLADPVRYLKLSLSRIPDYFEFWPSADTTLIHNIGRVGSFGLFLPFMLYGLYLAWRRMGRSSCRSWSEFLITPFALALLFVLFYPLLHILTWASLRYRLPVDAVVLPFAALAIDSLWTALRARRSRPTPVEPAVH